MLSTWLLSCYQFETTRRRNEKGRKKLKNVSRPLFLSRSDTFSLLTTVRLFKTWKERRQIDWEMNFNDEQRNIWISFGVISGVGFCFSFIHTWKWFSRSSKDVVDLQVKFAPEITWIKRKVEMKFFSDDLTFRFSSFGNNRQYLSYCRQRFQCLLVVHQQSKTESLFSLLKQEKRSTFCFSCRKTSIFLKCQRPAVWSSH